MDCPFCEQEMADGTLFGNNYKVKWMPADKSLFLGIWAHDSISLGKKGLLSRARIPNTYYCSQCRKFIMDVE